MSADFVIKEHDERPPFAGTITEPNGDAVDLTGCTVALNLRPMRSAELIVDGAEVVIDQGDLEILPASKGTWHYDLDLADLEGDTGYFFELVVTDSEGNEKTYPTDDYYTVAVYGRLKQDAS